jgi:hypothetical protein
MLWDKCEVVALHKDCLVVAANSGICIFDADYKQTIWDEVIKDECDGDEELALMLGFFGVHYNGNILEDYDGEFFSEKYDAVEALALALCKYHTPHTPEYMHVPTLQNLVDTAIANMHFAIEQEMIESAATAAYDAQVMDEQYARFTIRL